MFELGNNLREARQRRRIDLVAAEQDTKIRSKYLAALETEDFDVLPGPVFIRGFLRTYSRYLGLDPQLFIDEYNSRFGRFEDAEEATTGHALGRPGLAHERATRGRRTMRLAVVLTLVALAVLAWLAFRENDGQGSAKPAAHLASPSNEPETTGTGGSTGDLQAAIDAAEEPTTNTPVARSRSSKKASTASREAAAR